MENNQLNRDIFFKTCEALAQAPDAYINYRITAELMLSERDLSARDADATERVKVLDAMVDRYRDTPGEMECLMAAIHIAPQLGAYTFKDKWVKDLSERFAGNARAIAFRRTLIGATRMDIVFSGTFDRLDGTRLCFPYDRLGHSYFAVFWSKDSPLALTKLKQLKEQQDESPGLLELYSFNLDELPDAGQSIIKNIGLNCTVLKLPGGMRSETYRTYALKNPAALRVNQFGHAIVPPTMASQLKNEKDAEPFTFAKGYDDFAYPRIKSTNHISGYSEYDRYLSQIQSLLIGDFLLPTGASSSSVQESKQNIGQETLSVILDCFLPAPYRYRLTGDEALARYKQANERCIKALATYPDAPDSWKVRNCRIIALMGMANISGSPKYFHEAVKEAQMAASLNLPVEAMIIPKFCLAKQALRQGNKIFYSIITDFITQCGGEKAGLKAYSAAAILGIYADSRELYGRYRSRILASPPPLPRELAPVGAFFRSRYQQYYLFRGNPIFYLYSRIYRFAERRYMIDMGVKPMTRPLPSLTLKTVDGKTVSLPDTSSDRLTLLLFVEASDDESGGLPDAFYKPAGKPEKKNKTPQPSGLLASAYALAGQPYNNGLQCVTVFLNDDVQKVKAIRDKYGLSGLVTVLPGGLDNPVVNQLGILSPDRNVNSFLIRRNGTIAWRKNGIPYQMSGYFGYISSLAWRVHINACDTEAGYRALKNKDYNKALQLFTGTYLENKGDGTLTAPTADLLQGQRENESKWKSSRFHGRALANLALNHYDEALADIDNAISQHLAKNEFNHDPEKPCRTMIYLLTTKAKILDHLGRSSEARTARNKAAVEPTDYPTDYTRVRGFNKPYEVFEDKLAILAKEIK